MPGTCNDCGQAFTGSIQDHAEEAHPGLPRLRFRDAKGVNHLICPDCNLDVEEGGPKHMKSSGPHVPGLASDPVDLFSQHQQMHEGEA